VAVCSAKERHRHPGISRECERNERDYFFWHGDESRAAETASRPAGDPVSVGARRAAATGAREVHACDLAAALGDVACAPRACRLWPCFSLLRETTGWLRAGRWTGSPYGAVVRVSGG
jgi:uncharacterized protein YbjT (DUF2867 family)